MNSLLIRAEDKNQWERRTAVTPADLKKILDEVACTAWVEPSEKRFFPLDDYQAAGARESADMSPGDIILGVKEIPTEKILDNKVYLFFSHTIKGQKENMPMLKQIIAGKSTLIDYEKITDEQGRRLVYFGPFAGDAGALDLLWLMGRHWQHKGLENPFTECRQALAYGSVEVAMDHLKQVGQRIHSDGFPKDLCPLVIGVLGYGNVSRGAQKIFDCLPVERIDPEQLPALKPEDMSCNKVYMVVFKEEHLVQHKQGHPFELQDYYQQPENYQGIFSKYLPYLSLLVNATYWDKRYPRFVTWNDLARLYEADSIPKLQGIADITCDVNGSIECNVRTTDSGEPAYLVNPLDRSVSDGYLGNGIVLLAVDNLPAELPKDASEFFSDHLRPFLPGLVRTDFSQPLEKSGLPPELARAVIVYNGQLTRDYQYLREYL